MSGIQKLLATVVGLLGLILLYMSEVVALIEDARRRNINVQANVYPYTRGNNNLVSIIPPWAHEGGREKLLQRLRDPAQRDRIKRDIHGDIPGWYFI